jgi:hypothetical protein
MTANPGLERSGIYEVELWKHFKIYADIRPSSRDANGAHAVVTDA